jgi:hypothetical protein
VSALSSFMIGGSVRAGFDPDPGKTCKHGIMCGAFSVLLLLGGILSADENADRKAINAIIGSLYAPQVRSDPKRMAELTAADFDGDLDLIPIRTIWCETSCESFRVRSLKFVTNDVVIVDGETTYGEITSGTASMSLWLMVLKRDGDAWRISYLRSFGLSPFVRANRLTSN